MKTPTEIAFEKAAAWDKVVGYLLEMKGSDITRCSRELTVRYQTKENTMLERILGELEKSFKCG